MAFIEANILSVITDWLAPIGEKKILPHVQVQIRYYPKTCKLDYIYNLDRIQ